VLQFIKKAATPGRHPPTGGSRLLCETKAAIGAAPGPPPPPTPSGTRAAIRKKCNLAQVFQEVLSSGSIGQTLPEVNFDPEELTIQKIHQLKETLRSLERNDDTLGIALLKDTTLAERVTLTVLKE
jgi:hypothetical protein